MLSARESRDLGRERINITFAVWGHFVQRKVARTLSQAIQTIPHGGLSHVKRAYGQIRVHLLIYILDLSGKSAR